MLGKTLLIASMKTSVLSSEPQLKKIWAWWHLIVIPAQGRWKQADPWGLLASRPGFIGEFQFRKRLCLKETKLESS